MDTTRTITDEELLNLPKDGNTYEVVDGELRMSPAGWPHEVVVAELIALLAPYVKSRKLGRVLGSNTLYVLPSGIYRSLTDVRQIDEKDVLNGQDVVPGFSCKLREILDAEGTP